MDKKLPKGKGLYVWKIEEMPANWEDEFQDMGISWVAVKIANGISSSNRRRMPDGSKHDTILGPFTEKAKAAGFLVYGWQYVYCYNPVDEAYKAYERVTKFELDGFIIDAEHQCYGKHAQAVQYSTRLRIHLPDTPIGLSTYRFPDQHPRLPYKEFLDICDFNAPQVYWNAGKAGQELAESYEQYLEIKDLPFIPAGRAYYGEGFPMPTSREIVHFLNMAQSIGCPAAFFWSADALWHRLKSLPQIRKAIADYEWIGIGDPIPPVEPPSVPTTITLNDLEVQIEDAVYMNTAPIKLKKI